MPDWYDGVYFPPKDPGAVKFYYFDFAPATNRGGATDWLSSGVAIASYTITITGADSALTYDNDSLINSNTTVKFRLSGGTVGVEYRVECDIVTNTSPSETESLSATIFIDNQ